MEKKLNFTAERVATFECPQGKAQQFYWDAKTPGLGLRVTAAGVKSYIFQSKLDGSTLRMTIGDLRTWSIKAAQIRATELKAMVDQGVDPRQQREEIRLKREAEAAEMARELVTFDEAWTQYLTARQPKWRTRTYEDHVRHSSRGGIQRTRSSKLTEPGPLAPLLDVRLSEFSSARIQAWLEAESIKHPASTALSFRMLRAFIRWANDNKEYAGLIPESVYRAKSVREAVPVVRPKDGDCLQREQLPAWFAAVRRIRNPYISVYLQMLVLTGARREEMAALRWENVDLQWRQMTIGDKVEEDRTIPIPPYLAGLLASLPRVSEWVFYSARSASGRLEEPRIEHNKALAKAELPHITIHGLRRSFGTLSEWVDVPVGIAAQIQGHSPSALVEKHYRRRPIDLLRKWHERIEAWIIEQAHLCQAAPIDLPLS